MKRFAKKFEDIMTASAFAEAGEFKTAQEILKDGRRILLAIKEGHLDKKIFKYALNTCKRVVANLDILYISSTDKMDPALKQFLTEFEKEGIDYSLIRKEGCLEKEIKEYTDSHDKIAFVIIESSDALDINRTENSKLLEAWQNLNLQCPLVVVTDSAHA
jgi:predicted transcriptional regulator